MFKEALFAASLGFSPWHGDAETEEARLQRLQTIAEAIDIATLRAVCAEGAPPLPTLPAEGREQPEGKEGGEGKEQDSSASCQPIWRGPARELAFLLLTQAYFETHLAQHVHEGKCRVHLGECDGGKAISLWQLQAGAHLAPERWKRLSGTNLAATAHAAYEAGRALGRGRNYCGNLAGAISLYATGRTCRWQLAKKRASFSMRLAAQ